MKQQVFANYGMGNVFKILIYYEETEASMSGLDNSLGKFFFSLITWLIIIFPFIVAKVAAKNLEGKMLGFFAFLDGKQKIFEFYLITRNLICRGV